LTRSCVQHARSAARPPRGFTLLELLIVVSIIVILIGLTVGAGIAVIRNQQASATQNVLLTLDRALEEYIAQTQTIPPYNPADYEFVPGPDVETSNNAFFRRYPGAADPLHPRRPDAAVFIRQARGVGQIEKVITGIPDRFLISTPISGATAGTANADVTPSVIDTWAADDWAEPWSPLVQKGLIYYVHPQNTLAQALYGKCQNGRPYFMSAGPDSNYGFRDEAAPQATGANPESDADYLARFFKQTMADNIYSYPVGEYDATLDFVTNQRD
jgi:prepilin-type N-terminal cleavage/methylation domain-containing protein